MAEKHSLTFYIELCSKFAGEGLNLPILERKLFGDPRFFSFF